MRPISTIFRNDSQKQSLGSPYVTLLTLNYTGATVPLHFVNNYQAIESNGVTYEPFAFDFTMPQEGETIRPARLVINNVDRRLAEFVMQVPSGEIITVTERLADATRTSILSDNGIEITREYILRNVQVTRKTVSGELYYLEYLKYAYPKLRKTPDKFPGIF
jgi:hypothetical protein